MTYLTITEQETRAYMAGDVQLANALAQCEDYLNELENQDQKIIDMELKYDSVVFCTCHSGYKGE